MRVSGVEYVGKLASEVAILPPPTKSPFLFIRFPKLIIRMYIHLGKGLMHVHGVGDVM